MGQCFFHAGFPPHALFDYRTRSSTEKQAGMIMGILLASVCRAAQAFVHYCPILGLTDCLFHHINGQDDPLGHVGRLAFKFSV